MVNAKAVKPLVVLLQATEIGGREGVDENSREWEIRADREGGDELDGPAEH